MGYGFSLSLSNSLITWLIVLLSVMKSMGGASLDLMEDISSEMYAGFSRMFTTNSNISLSFNSIPDFWKASVRALLKTMADAGLALQTGFLGWGAVVRGKAPSYRPFATGGSFRWVRQPVYVAFALTLWTAPVWTPDHLILALAWTAYCVLAPRHKERRYLAAYGEDFERYRQAVPYWLPRRRSER